MKIFYDLTKEKPAMDMLLDAVYQPTEKDLVMSLSPTEKVKVLSQALQTINRQARTTYKARPGHDEAVATIGIIAENALINSDIEVEYEDQK